MKDQDNYGIVYVLTNPAMPGLVKIGMTTRDEVDVRMRELFNTGVPVPFECKYACRVLADSCRKVEKALHKAFKHERIHPDREFFKIEADQAIAILELLDTRDEITDQVQTEIDNDLTADDKASVEKLKRKRRPSVNFIDIGIPAGEKIQFGLEGDIVEAIVAPGGRKVEYKGEKRYITLIEKELKELGHQTKPWHWYYKGRLINDIYNEKYSFEDEQ